MACTIDRLDHLVPTVADIGLTIDFYTNLLGMQAIVFADRKALKFGQQKMNLQSSSSDAGVLLIFNNEGTIGKLLHAIFTIRITT